MNATNMKPNYTITPGKGGLPRLQLVAPDGARLEVYLQGAHITSWVPAGGEERLFLSRASQFRAGAPIRGGIPVAFPQFAAFGPLPLHGFARLMPWEFVGAQAVGERASAAFRLRDTEQSRRLWPHAFLAELSATVGGAGLEVALGVTNTGGEAFEFSTALHTYFSVPDLAETFVQGLSGVRCLDSAAGGIEYVDREAQVGFGGEVNRVYYDAPAEARLVEPGRTTVIRKTGFADTVVWNPGAERCATTPDLEPNDYRRYVCVESVSVGVPVRLDAGERWIGRQILIV